MNNTQKSPTNAPSSKHKGGRPSIPDDQKRTCCKKVYFTQEDAECVERAADENRMSDSEYINQMTVNGKVVAPISVELARDFRAVASVSINLNQLAHQANKEGYHSVANDMLVEWPKLKQLLHKLFESI